MKILVLTNNPMVFSTYGDLTEVEFHKEASYLEVMIKIRDKVHEGYKLLSHPLSGSIKPNETPYKTVVLEDKGEFDMDSLMLIENAIQTTEKFNRSVSAPKKWPEKILGDFQLIDYDLIKSSINKSL